MPNSEQQNGLQRRIVISMVLLAAYAAVVVWVLYDQATSWPHEGSWASLVFFFLCPGIVFQAFNLAYMQVKARPLTRRVLTRVITIPLGLVVAAALVDAAGRFAVRDFQSAYAPFAADIGTNLTDPCGSAAQYFAIPSVVAYNRQTGHERVAAKLRYDRKRFVLSLSGGSIDADGSTIYFDSGAKAWGKFHNDNAARSRAFTTLTEGLAECTLRTQ